VPSPATAATPPACAPRGASTDAGARSKELPGECAARGATLRLAFSRVATIVDDTPEAQAWLATLEELAPRLHAWTHLRLRGEDAATKEDFVQEVLYRAVANHARFTGGNATAWVFQIAKHVLFESLRRRRREGRVQAVDGHTSRFAALHEMPASVTNISRRVARSDDFRQLMLSVADLDDVDQRLVVLCGLEGESVKTAAVQIGLGDEACAKRWYRLRQRLRTELGGEQSA